MALLMENAKVGKLMKKSHVFWILRLNPSFCTFLFLVMVNGNELIIENPKIRNARVQPSQAFSRKHHSSCRIERNEFFGITHNRNTRQNSLVLNILFAETIHIYISVSAFALCHSLTFSESYRITSWVWCTSTEIASKFMAFGRGRSAIACFWAARLCTSPLPSSNCQWLYVTKCDVASLSFPFRETIESYIMLFFFFLFKTWAEIWTQPSRGLNAHKKKKKTNVNTPTTHIRKCPLFFIADPCRCSMFVFVNHEANIVMPYAY